MTSNKLKLAVFGLVPEKSPQANNRQRECYNQLLKLSSQQNGNAIVLADYILAYRQDNPGIAERSLSTDIMYLIRFAAKVGKPFCDMTKDDLLRYFEESLKKPESGTDKWRGTFNLFQVIVSRFFKWLYSPD